MSAGRPAGRLGNYVADVALKLYEVAKIAHEVDASAVLCAGDVFHHSVPALSAVDRFLDFLDFLDRRFVTIPGSHDLVGNNLDALSRTAIGLLDRLGKIKLLSSITDDVFPVDHFVVGIHGGASHNVELVHRSVSPKPEFGEYTLLGDYRTCAKVVVVGHVHGGYDLTTVGRTTFVCPGSLVRTVAQRSELTRRPRVAILHSDFRIEWRELQSAKPGEEVLAPPVVSPEVDFACVVREWASVDIEEIDAAVLLREVAAQEGVSDEVIEYALAMLGG